MNISFSQAKSRVEQRMHQEFPWETQSIDRLFTFMDSEAARSGRSMEMHDLFAIVNPSTVRVFCLFMRELEEASIARKRIYLSSDGTVFAGPFANIEDIPLEVTDHAGKTVKVLLDHLLPQYEFLSWIEF